MIGIESLTTILAGLAAGPTAFMSWPGGGVQDLADWSERHRAWLERGNAASMSWMERNAPLAFDPQAVWPPVQSVGVQLLPWAGGVKAKEPAMTDGLVAACARGPDYHKVQRRQLTRLAEALAAVVPGLGWRILVDANPLSERYVAVMAGLGFIGRNTMLINPQLGSACTIGIILLNQRVPDLVWGSASSSAPRSCPAGCRRCLEACPTAALSADGLDARRCLSWKTIEDDTIAPGPDPARGRTVYGCDACTRACPFNQHTYPGAGTIDLRTVLAFRSHDDLVRTCAGTSLMRPGWRGMVRNAMLATAANADPGLQAALELWTREKDPELAALARSVLEGQKNPQSI